MTLSEWLSSYSFFLLELFIPWCSFLGVFYTSLHVDPTLVFMTFSLHWHLFIILYEVTRQSQATESPGQTLWAPRIVWTRAKPQTTEHDMKALHILANDGLTQYRLDFPFLFIHPLLPSVKSWQSNQAPQWKRMHWTSLFQLITIPSHKPVLICIPFNLREAGEKKCK